MTTINCYARVSGSCLNGKPLIAEGDPDYMMEDDGTYVRQIDAVCCTNCYARVGAPLLADLTLAIMKAKGVTVTEEEIDTKDLRAGDLWYWAPLEWAPGIIGNKINLAIFPGTIINETSRVWRVTITRQ